MKHLPVVYDRASYGEPCHLVMALRHHNRSSAFYADGHVELFDTLSLKYEGVTRERDNAAYVESFVLESE